MVTKVKSKNYITILQLKFKKSKNLKISNKLFTTPNIIAQKLLMLKQGVKTVQAELI